MERRWLYSMQAALAAGALAAPITLADDKEANLESNGRATDASARDTDARPAQHPHPAFLVEGEKLIGLKVTNAQREDLGRIHDAVLDLSNGRVAYVVLDTAGYMGDKLFAVPMQSFRIYGADQPVLLDANKDTFKNAQGFDNDRWPDAADRSFMNETYRDFKAEPYVSDAQAAAGDKGKLRTNRLSKLEDRGIKDAQGKTIGEIEELMIDTREGRIAYAVLDIDDGAYKLDDKEVAVPWSALSHAKGDDRALTLHADPTTLQSLAFNPTDRPNFNDEGYGRRVHSTFQKEPYWQTYGYASDGDDRGKKAHKDLSLDKLLGKGEKMSLQGQVTDIDRYDGTVHLKVKTSDGRTVFVQYEGDAKDLRFKEGDSINVTGTQLTIMKATQIQSGGQTLKVDD